jgi:hypothetical protein
MIHMMNFIHMYSSSFMMPPSLAIWVGIQPQHTYEISPCHHFHPCWKFSFMPSIIHHEWYKHALICLYVYMTSITVVFYIRSLIL